MAYGELTSLGLVIRDFEIDITTLTGLGIGVIYFIILICYLIGLYQYPIWFGSFKRLFFKGSISGHYYLISSLERITTAGIVAFLSPGYTVAAAVSVIFLAEVFFIGIKKPYILGQWKRPLSNKLINIAIALLYSGSSLTNQTSLINILIPLVVLMLLCLTLTIGAIGAISSIKVSC